MVKKDGRTKSGGKNNTEIQTPDSDDDLSYPRDKSNAENASLEVAGPSRIITATLEAF